MIDLMLPPNKALEGIAAIAQEADTLQEQGMIQCESLLCHKLIRPKEAYTSPNGGAKYCTLECCQDS